MLLRKTLINSFAEKEYHDTDKSLRQQKIDMFGNLFMYQHAIKASDEMRRLHKQFYGYDGVKFFL